MPLLGAGDVDGLPFYTMPYVAGASLRERMQAGPIPIEAGTGPTTLSSTVDRELEAWL